MFDFILRRLLSIIPTMFIIVTASFFIMRAAPGGPFSSERELPPAVMANIMARYNLDESLPRQYLRFLGNTLRGDLGPSFVNRDFTVNQIIGGSLPNSVILGLTGLVVAVFLGIIVGIISALKKNSIIDYTTMSVAVLGISIPSFVIGPLLILILATGLGLLPTSGWITGRNGLLTLIMPALTLASAPFAYIARMTRGSVLETLRSDYVRTARAKGLATTTILYRHVLKGSLLPVVSYLGPLSAAMVTGTFVIESIFAIPGLGMFLIRASQNRDYTVIMGGIIVYSLILVMMNFIVDIIYGFLDPRISYK